MAEKKSFDSTTEEGIAAASYVLTFYKEVMTLTHWKSLYKNLLTEMNAKHIGKIELSTKEKDMLKTIQEKLRDMKVNELDDEEKELFEECLKKVIAKLKESKLGQQEIADLQQYAQSVRYYADKTQTLYFSIINDLSLSDKEKDNIDKIKEALIVIEESYIIPKEAVDAYIGEIHKFLLKDVIKGLLKSAQDTIEAVYGKAE